MAVVKVMVNNNDAVQICRTAAHEVNKGRAAPLSPSPRSCWKLQSVCLSASPACHFCANLANSGFPVKACSCHRTPAKKPGVHPRTEVDSHAPEGCVATGCCPARKVRVAAVTCFCATVVALTMTSRIEACSQADAAVTALLLRPHAARLLVVHVELHANLQGALLEHHPAATAKGKKPHRAATSQASWGVRQLPGSIRLLPGIVA
jgi:hypothetical protein